MGWERKRGKLAEFNRLLRGATDTSFIVQHGDLSMLPSVRYVITLDSDTQLPLDAARRLVGTLAHPLNRPRFDAARAARHRRLRHPAAARRRQPRQRQPHARSRRSSPATSASIRTRPRSPTSTRTCSTRAATSARASTTSTRSRRALAGRVPENALLSHDLFEGCYARAARAPTSSSSTTTRRTTWRSRRGSTAGSAATGRSSRWLWRTVPDANGAAGPEPAAGHRALEDPRQPAAQPGAAGAGRCCSSPAGRSCRVAGCCGRRWRCWCSRFRRTSRSAGRSASRVRGRAAARAHRAPSATRSSRARARRCSRPSSCAHQSVRDARRDRPHAVRGCWSRGARLLEWVTADRAARRRASSAHGVSRRCGTAPALAVAIGALVAVVAPGRLPLALPV